ncbi:hypothetical protein H9P43_009128 [Blastocladiella emersonii ATCC 22665]|nr:hypothetical protein H9P43_009128 [Blastocladiella emersonii ATCC 22665]
MPRLDTVQRRVGMVTPGDGGRESGVATEGCVGGNPFVVGLDLRFQLGGKTEESKTVLWPVCTAYLDDKEKMARFHPGIATSRGGLVSLELDWNERGFTRVAYNGQSYGTPGPITWKQDSEADLAKCRLASLTFVTAQANQVDLGFACPPFPAALEALQPTMFGSTTPVALYAGIGAAVLLVGALAVVRHRRSARAAGAKRDSDVPIKPSSPAAIATSPAAAPTAKEVLYLPPEPRPPEIIIAVPTLPRDGTDAELADKVYYLPTAAAAERREPAAVAVNLSEELYLPRELSECVERIN